MPDETQWSRAPFGGWTFGTTPTPTPDSEPIVTTTATANTELDRQYRSWRRAIERMNVEQMEQTAQAVVGVGAINNITPEPDVIEEAVVDGSTIREYNPNRNRWRSPLMHMENNDVVGRHLNSDEREIMNIPVPDDVGEEDIVLPNNL